MTIFTRIKNGFKGFRAGFQSISDIDNMLQQIIEGRPIHSGVSINKDTAMNYSAWYNGCMQISQTIASLPLVVYLKQGENKKIKYEALPLFKILGFQANIRTAAYIWKEVTQFHLLSWGNAYSFIQRDRGNRVLALWLMDPSKMRKIEIEEDGNLVYYFQNNKGTLDAYEQDEILHIPGLGFDGVRGYSVLKLARESIGLGIAYEEFAARFIGSGTHVGGILKKKEGRLSPEARTNLKKSFNEAYSGLGNTAKVIVLEEGLDFEKTIMPLEDAQFLQSRVFSIQEMARWLNMPPHKLKDLSHATYSNIEQEQMTYYQDTIRPWLERWESVMHVKLLSGSDQERAYIEFNFNAILRADIKSRYEAYDIMRRNGSLSANEWRGLENMNPIEHEHGDAFWMPLNMVNAEMITEKQEVIKNEEPGKEEIQETDEEGEEKSFAEIEKRLVEINKLDQPSVRSIIMRRKTTETYRDLFEKTITNIVLKENRDIKKILKNNSEKDLFKNEIKKYYSDFRKYIELKYSPIIYSYAEEIAEIACNEIDSPKDNIPGLDNEINNFIDVSAKRYVISSQGQLNKIVRESKIDEFENDIIQRLNEWKDTRVNKIVWRELIDNENGFFQFIIFAGGFATRWVTIGKSCPYCNMLDGKIISRGQYFITKGDALQPEGKDPMIVKSNISHPSAHAGCDCTMSASRSLI